MRILGYCILAVIIATMLIFTCTYPPPAYSLATVAVAEQLAQWQAGVDLSGMDYSDDCFLEGKKDEWENELQ